MSLPTHDELSAMTAQILIDRFNVAGMVRASLAFYNTMEEIDRFIEATKQVRRMLG